MRTLADLLQQEGVRTFYDEFEKVSLWGKDLYAHLQDIYQNQARYCVMFVSKHYAKKAWTSHERRSAQSRALVSETEYLLPVRFDDTSIPGVPDTIGFVDLRETSPQQLRDIIVGKIGPRPRENYFPPLPDRLFKRLKARSQREKDLIAIVSQRFFKALTMTDKEERGLIYNIFSHSCPVELPENVHVDLDLLRRITKMSPSRIKRVAARISSLGFEYRIRDSDCPTDDSGHSGPLLVLEWQNRSIEYGGNFTWLASELIECSGENFLR
ncbi:TIR domain-containing protein [Sphingomonas psychrotolerans]|uniref:TIR domain-containing protein n=1 Tax=Sphingomonas psychrotolerans TaxID=1327635 RepID=UPI0018F444EC|nr:TIR domain-containing protein [Sphingomonas psychrotolerans]